MKEGNLGKLGSLERIESLAKDPMLKSLKLSNFPILLTPLDKKRTSVWKPSLFYLIVSSSMSHFALPYFSMTNNT